MFIGWSRMDHEKFCNLGGYTQYKNIKNIVLLIISIKEVLNQ